MSDGMDLSFLDHPESLEIVFPVVYTPFRKPGTRKDA